MEINFPVIPVIHVIDKIDQLAVLHGNTFGPSGGTGRVDDVSKAI